MNKIPLNNLSRFSIEDSLAIKNVLAEVVDSGEYILGSRVRQFESKLANFIDTDFAIAVASGTDALELGLRAIGITSGDTVATVANAGGYTTTALRAIGARPLYVDCDWSGRMDAQDLRQKLDFQPNVSAIVVTHLYGLSSNILEVVGVGQERGLKILEDCAQSIGATVQGRRLGSFGDVSTFSFYPTKNLGALGDAGAVLTSDEEIAQRVSQLRQYGWTSRYINDVEYGRNSRMDEFQAAILSLRIEQLDEVNELRRNIWNDYSRALRASNFEIIGQSDPSFVAHLAILLAPQGLRNWAIEFLENLGIQVGIHYPLLDKDQNAWRKYSNGELPVAQDFVERIFTIPLFPTLTVEELDAIRDALELLATESEKL